MWLCRQVISLLQKNDPWQETKKKYTKKRKGGILFKIFYAGSSDRFTCICHLFHFPLGIFFKTKESHIWNSLACCDGHSPTWWALPGGEFPEVSLKGGSQHALFHVASRQHWCVFGFWPYTGYFCAINLWFRGYTEDYGGRPRKPKVKAVRFLVKPKRKSEAKDFVLHLRSRGPHLPHVNVPARDGHAWTKALCACFYFLWSL